MPSDNIGIALLSLLIVLALPAFADTPAKDAAGGSCDYTAVELYREVSPTVVSISGMAINPFDPRERVSWAVGSGIIVDSEGLILTNAHLVQDLDDVYVTLGDSMVAPAEVLGMDSILDLAVLRVPGGPGAGLPAAKLGDSDDLQVGEEVFAIGNPMGLEKSLSGGIISALGRTLPVRPMSWLVPYSDRDLWVNGRNVGSSGGVIVPPDTDVIYEIEVLEQEASGAVDAERGTELLQAIRWLGRVSSHLRKICRHLGWNAPGRDPPQAGLPREAAGE